MEPASTVGSGAKENRQPFRSPTRLLPQRLLICYQPLPQSSGAGEWQGFFLLEFDTSFLPAAAPRNPPLGRREAGRGGAETSGNFFRPLLPRLPGNDPGDSHLPPDEGIGYPPGALPGMSPAHFLLFLPPASAPAASCGSPAKFIISGKMNLSSEQRAFNASLDPLSLSLPFHFICESRSMRAVAKIACSFFFFLLINDDNSC